MPRGTLEVVLVDAKGLDNNDFLAKISPYAVLQVKTQEKKSTVLSGLQDSDRILVLPAGKGSNPEWNESFLFKISDDEVKELRLTIMDKDNFSADDFVGEATIPLLTAYVKGTVDPTTYNIVNKDKEFRGGIKLGLTFTPESGFLPGRSDHGSGEHGEEVSGGWKQSSHGEERLGGRNEPSYGEGRHGGRNEPTYGDERPPYSEERPPHGEERPPFRGDRPPYGEDRPSFGGDRPPYGEDRPPFGEDRPPFGGNRPPCGEDRPPFGEDRPPCGEDRPPFRGERPPYGEERPPFEEGRHGGRGELPYEEGRHGGRDEPTYGEGRHGGRDEPTYGEGRPGGWKH